MRSKLKGRGSVVVTLENSNPTEYAIAIRDTAQVSMVRRVIVSSIHSTPDAKQGVDWGLDCVKRGGSWISTAGGLASKAR